MSKKRERSKGPVSSISDADLIEASKADPSAFGVLFDRHLDRVYAYIVRRVGPSLAEELTAETLTSAFEQRARFVPVHDTAAPWLYGIATNVVHKAWRAERRQLAAYLRASTLSTGRGDDFTDADERVDAKRAAAEMVAALAKLSSDDRDALLLFAWEQLSYDEIASALGLPVGTVASRISRARKQLRAAKPVGHDSMGAL